MLHSDEGNKKFNLQGLLDDDKNTQQMLSRFHQNIREVMDILIYDRPAGFSQVVKRDALEEDFRQDFILSEGQGPHSISPSPRRQQQ